jgi:acetyl esterase
METVRAVVVPGPVPVEVRLYVPSPSPTALLVYFHGGGWVLGDLESHDGTCRNLAKATDFAVLAVNYRRGPEHPWPAAVDDAVVVTTWAKEHAGDLVGVTRVLVAGDSAGGNLAALACLRLRDEGRHLPDAQVLIYPNTDLTFSQPSVIEKSSGWGLEAADARWFAGQWVSEQAQFANPRVSPLFEPDLSGLPRAIVVTAEHDPLRDEGEAYASRLCEAGVVVHAWRERGLVHGFLGLTHISPTASAASARLYESVRGLYPRTLEP